MKTLNITLAANHAAIIPIKHKANSLSEFVRLHCGCNVERVILGGKLLVVSSDIACNGKVSRMIETIPANWQSVRNWLGY